MQEFGGMAACGIGNDFATQHTRDFLNALMMVQHADFADGLLPFAMLANLPMVFTARGDLRKMGYRQDLMFFT